MRFNWLLSIQFQERQGVQSTPFLQKKGLRYGFLMSVLLLTTCQLPKDYTVNRSFYFWRQSFNLYTTETTALQWLDINTVYLKFFDVKWDEHEGAIPVATTYLSTQLPDTIATIPTVYITNEVFQKLDAQASADLADKVRLKITDMLAKIKHSPIPEIQLDCDWTQSTKEKYFHFLETFKSKIAGNIQVSATIRLHQIKYFKKTGVPPVDKGLLMYYNMGNVKQLDSPNSILDNEIGAQYISKNSSYPLPLDVALPIFEWGVLFSGKEFKGILNGMNEATLAKEGIFKPFKKNVYQAQRDRTLRGTYIRKGDFLRLENSPFEELQKATTICRQILNTDTLNVSFFHLEASLINQLGHEKLQSLYQAF